MARKTVLQHLDGYNEVDLKNYLFCIRHGLRGSSRVYTLKNRYMVGRDARNILTFEKRIGKPFDKITLRDLLHSDQRSMYTAICDNIYFRYFNIDLIKDIVSNSELTISDISSRYCIQSNKAQGLSVFDFDEYSYIAKFEEDK